MNTQDHRRLLAQALESAIFQCLVNAQDAATEAEEQKWFKQADKLEKKFTADPELGNGRHYSYFL